ncbi:MAG: hypothetical protein KatS3mg009_0170 [Acidimicrobiia bacterium]|nr:MAG: hypothetical protein KatS3mg009_0170 [Acidimicrobiia bacterium]
MAATGPGPRRRRPGGAGRARRARRPGPAPAPARGARRPARRAGAGPGARVLRGRALDGRRVERAPAASSRPGPASGRGSSSSRVGTSRAASPTDDGPGARVDLEPLGRDASVRLVEAARAGGPLPRPSVEAVVARADGNPLFLLEIVSALQAGGELDALPDTVEGLIAARIDRLPPPERSLLRRLAVLGSWFREEYSVAVVDTAPDASDLGAPGGVPRRGAGRLDPVPARARARRRVRRLAVRDAPGAALAGRRTDPRHGRPDGRGDRRPAVAPLLRGAAVRGGVEVLAARGRVGAGAVRERRGGVGVPPGPGVRAAARGRPGRGGGAARGARRRAGPRRVLRGRAAVVRGCQEVLPRRSPRRRAAPAQGGVRRGAQRGPVARDPPDPSCAATVGGPRHARGRGAPGAPARLGRGDPRRRGEDEGGAIGRARGDRARRGGRRRRGARAGPRRPRPRGGGHRGAPRLVEDPPRARDPPSPW